MADRGPGIPEAERGRVLERFVRLESARSRPGFGLGLSLAAAVARLHGGRCGWRTTQPGLRAVLCLPLKASGAAAAAAAIGRLSRHGEQTGIFRLPPAPGREHSGPRRNANEIAPCRIRRPPSSAA